MPFLASAHTQCTATHRWMARLSCPDKLFHAHYITKVTFNADHRQPQKDKPCIGTHRGGQHAANSNLNYTLKNKSRTSENWSKLFAYAVERQKVVHATTHARLADE